MPSRATIGQMKTAGEKLKHLQCAARGCTKNRRGISPLCVAHEQKKARYGHPLGKPISQREYFEELKEVSEFFKDHGNHPAITSAAHFFEKWLSNAGDNVAGVGQYIFGRLHGRLIIPMEILTEVSAVWLYAQRYPGFLPDDHRLTFCLARNVARLATFERRFYGDGTDKSRTLRHPPPRELKSTGERIRQTLARFFVNLTHALQAKVDQEKSYRANLSTSFI